MQTENDCEIQTPLPPTWRDHLTRYIFPTEIFPWAEGPHGLTSDLKIVLSWRDRLRVLLGGVVHTRVIVDLTQSPGRTLMTRAYTAIERPASAPPRSADAD